MTKERAHLDLADDLDISEFLPIKKKKNKEIELKSLEEVAEQSGFVSRKNKIHRRKRPQSPFKNQLNLKCRDGVKELFQDIGEKLHIHDHTTFELALLALIENKNLSDLIQRYKEIVK